jgi:LPXTG-motif cell wall-anchored protein
MSAHHRSLATAAAAGAVLIALCFVPSAKATPDASARHTAHAAQHAAQHAARQQQRQLADTGGFETAPYMAGGLSFLGAGGVLVARSMRGVA